MADVADLKTTLHSYLRAPLVGIPPQRRSTDRGVWNISWNSKSGEIPEKVGVVPESFNVALTAVVHTVSAVHCRVVLVDCIDRRAVGLSDIVPCTVGVAG